MDRFATCSLAVTAYAGFEALEFGNSALSLIIIPSLGGKIVSLFHRASGTAVHQAY